MAARAEALTVVARRLTYLPMMSFRDASKLCQPLGWEGRDAAQRVRPLLRRQGLLRNRCATAGAALQRGEF
jgi:hypothetical protein